LEGGKKVTHKMTRILLDCTGFDMSEFAQRLRLLRESRQLTQVRLAELIEVDARAYNRWERGTIAPQLDTLIRIADVLQVPLDELVGRKPVSGEVRIRNHSLNALWQQADTLPDQEQQALILVIDSFVKKAIVEKAVGMRADLTKRAAATTTRAPARTPARSSKRAAHAA
jgi:transcriptional regulator with XRE-family HTH domain